jgi:hypothetical protein
MSISMIILVGDLLPLGLAGILGIVYAIVPLGRRRLSRAAVLPGPRQAPSLSVISGVLGVAALIIAFSALLRWLLVSANASSAPFSYVWWAYTSELLVANGAVAFIIVVLALFGRKPESPVPPTQPRTWRTYVTTRQLWLPGVALAALLLLVAFAGSVSSPDEEGIYRLLVVQTGSDASGASEFFGWAYGLPVAGAALLLTALTISALHANAARPFHRLHTVPAEEASRRALSTRVLWFACGVLFLILGRTMILVGASARMEINGPEYVWGTSIAALDPWLSWTGMVVKLFAYTLLLLVGGTTRFRARRPSVAEPDTVVDEKTSRIPFRG